MKREERSDIVLERMICSSDMLCTIFKGDKNYAIALPHSLSVGKNALPWHYHPESAQMCNLLGVNKLLGSYIKKYGEHVFYLGKFSNPNGAKFSVFSFPTKFKTKEECDATMIVRSCEALVRSCNKYAIDICLLPTISFDFEYKVFEVCYKPIFDLILDDHYMLIHKVNTE